MDNVISHNSALDWSTRLCDITPLDGFLWDYVKDQAYADNPKSIEALTINIQRLSNEIEPQFCKNVIENVDKRIDIYKNDRLS